jgi:hypothetical protein
VYDESTRTITWNVGEVGPGEQGFFDMSVAIANDAVAGTEIDNFATVYFPSVPEITPTNAVRISVITSSTDIDGDQIADTLDNCPEDANPGQENTDQNSTPPGDGWGDFCDDDDDDDDLPDHAEDYLGLNPLDPDTNHDGLGDELEDTDDDDLSNISEATDYFTDLVEPDTDFDGCKDGAEVGSNPASGGLRNPLNPWDYFNPGLDGFNRIPDITDVVLHYGQDEGVPGSTYDTRYDRTALAGGHPWQFDAPNGTIRAIDVTAAVLSYGHDCGPYA